MAFMPAIMYDYEAAPMAHRFAARLAIAVVLVALVLVNFRFVNGGDHLLQHGGRDREHMVHGGPTASTHERDGKVVYRH